VRLEPTQAEQVRVPRTDGRFVVFFTNTKLGLKRSSLFWKIALTDDKKIPGLVIFDRRGSNRSKGVAKFSLEQMFLKTFFHN
jgi:hypothetical protein